MILINSKCTYAHQLNILNKKFKEVLEERKEIEKEMNFLMNDDTEHISPYYFQSQYIVIQNRLTLLNENLKVLNQKIKKLKYEICN